MVGVVESRLKGIPMTLTAAQSTALDQVTRDGSARLDTATNPALGTIHHGTARALQERGLLVIWARKHHVAEAVLPGSDRDCDLDGIAN